MTFQKWVRVLAWRHFIALLAIAFALFPLIWMASASFDELGKINTQSLIPQYPGFGNYRALWSNPDQPYWLWMRNSVMIASINAVLQLAIGATAAYALSRFRYRGRKTTLMTILIIQMFPQLLAVTAFYVILADLRESIPFMDFGSPIALLVIFAGGALGINAWMLKGFFDSIPSEIDESAKIDGASHGQIYVRIILPLALPMLAVVALLSFIGTMNEFLLTAVILGGNQEAITLAVGMRQFIETDFQENWGAFAAGALIATLPVMILFIWLQKFVVSGLTAGSLKG
ncbi:MAG: sugar ABC transporter permease [Actinobacteria bacterium]|jgi:arabinogalactan oligomer/maltooligosaccharide transport system permease protein|nr:sugar ABC transporter permease [Actinomycetota bacterium]NBT83015.1 sugar ABC transporter permease [Betaproteobacteria bacterium]NBO47558.1 sugar ABC transporter permease [Actinomycetota bacterium]NBP12185.1 sugar ABC transporter permease [Actinomycetota bacterium]NBP22287.1 sugar ABC transporter permease [Actinomycetota bacterium]